VKYYQVVEHDLRIKNPLVADSADLKGRSEWWHYAQGHPIEDWDESAWFKVTKKKNEGQLQDVLPNHLALHIFSAKLRAAFEKNGIKGVQFLPVRIFRYTGEEVKGYAIANILYLLPALDLKESSYDVFPDDDFLPERRGKIRWISKIVLRRPVIDSYDIFRLAENEVKIVASENFKNIFDSNSFSGYSFNELKVVE
jgi:hypothetical protein